MKKLKVLFATSEVAPLIKTGGLADVSGALPAALRSIGVDMRVLVPGYNPVIEQLSQPQLAATLDIPGFPSSRLLSSTMSNGVPLLVLDCPTLYQREGGPYQTPRGEDWSDNAMRFGLLSKVTALLGSGYTPLEWHPDLVHCNDWQTGLAPAYLHLEPDSAPSIISVHNLAFQGNFPPETVPQLGLPWSCYTMDGIEFYGQMSFLKAALFYADHITTVSPTYAKEIQQEELGFGMQGLLAYRREHLTGILNGIDPEEWDPDTDPHLSKPYSSSDMAGKVACKAALQRRMALDIEPDIPLLGVVSRLTHQKGLDALLEIVPRVCELPAQLAVLGSGDAQMQKTAKELAKRFPGQVGVMIGFDVGLSHQIEAGADMFVMPSRFEPCGLNQMYSQRYGTPPVVNATGGLADSVVDCTARTLKEGTASGFSFSGVTPTKLYKTIKRAIDTYQDKPRWNALINNCMNKDSSWHHSAEAYLAVYEKVLGQR